MIIYPLLPAELDDVTLSRQIKALAQCLCNVHAWAEFHKPNGKALKDTDIPLMPKNADCEYSKYARTCAANYDFMAKLGLACCIEYGLRFGKITGILENGSLLYESFKQHKLRSVIEWADKNQLSLPIFHQHFNKDCVDICGKISTPFPLVMPDKYQVVIADGKQPYTYDTEESYRNYYRAKLEKGLTPVWTRRPQPSWLGDLK
jgi:hypothetical protein